MKSEEIIMLVFVGVLVVGIPLLLWFINKEQERERQEELNRWKTKNK